MLASSASGSPSYASVVSGAATIPASTATRSSNSSSYNCKSMLRNSSQLEILNLCKSRITDDSIFRMSFLIALVEIRLQFCSGITSTGIAALARNCPRLRLIDLKSCPVTDAALAAIAELSTELRELDLSWCPSFTDEGLEMLQEFFERRRRRRITSRTAKQQTGAPRIEQGEEGRQEEGQEEGQEEEQELLLKLAWCPQVTDRGALALSRMAPVLRSVQLTGCAGVSTEDGHRVLREAGVDVLS